MFKRLVNFSGVSVLTAFIVLVNIAHAQLDTLASRVPSHTNCLVIMDVDKVMASAAATAGDWQKKVQAANAAGMTLIPRGTNKAIFASQLDLEYMAPIWQTVILQMKSSPSVDAIAK